MGNAFEWVLHVGRYYLETLRVGTACVWIQRSIWDRVLHVLCEEAAGRYCMAAVPDVWQRGAVHAWEFKLGFPHPRPGRLGQKGHLLPPLPHVFHHHLHHRHP